VQTDGAGQYAFTGLAPADWQVQPGLQTNPASAVSALDAAYVLQAMVGMRTLDGWQRLACDVTGNGTLSALDAALILQYKVGMITTLPVTQTCGADWAFVPVPAPASNQQLVEPAASSGSCGSGTISYQPLAGSFSGQDFLAVVFGDCTGNWQPGATGPATQARQSAGVHLGHTRAARQRIRVPVNVDPDGALHALDIEVHYDPAHLTPAGVHRAGGARHALMAANQTTPGVLAVSLASGPSLQGGTVLMLYFDVKDARSPQAALRLVRADADEH
jgi:hypothetical protein